MTKRRALICVVAAIGGILAAVACTAFDDVPRPQTAPTDAGGPPVDLVDAGEDAAPIVLPAPGMLPLSVAAQLCSLVATCELFGYDITTTLQVPLSEPNFSLCLTELSTTLEPKRLGRAQTASLLSTLANAPSCAAAAASLSLEFIPPQDPRCPADGGLPFYACLDTRTAITCPGSNQVGVVRHCGAPNHVSGESCFAFDGGAVCVLAAGCGGASCTGARLDVCRPSDGDPRYHTSIDCNFLGMECVVDPSTMTVGCGHGAQILQPPVGSAMPFGASCDGTKRVVTTESYQAAIDCASLGATCNSKGRGAVCTFPDDECSPLVTEGTCEGTNFHGCVGGKKTVFDCASIGKACVEGDSSSTFAAACR